MNVWLAMILGGLITFGMRFSFIYLLGRFKVPQKLRLALHYVPPAVLSALIFPALLIRSNALDVSIGNTYLMAGIVAAAVGLITKNTLMTIVAGLISIILFTIL
jgi:branched-subunit amino acid transport protein